MTTRTSRRVRAQRSFRTATILATGMLAIAATPARAQNQSVDDQGTSPSASAEDQIVITGIRGSLASSARAKREATGFTESVFAEDIGDFPDTNLAESFNRVPGITISREITGEGLNIAIRGLGTNFTRILLNGAPVAIASTGRTDAQNTNREVDLDLFPSELFTQLTVFKSPMASMIEGGAAGTVNMRTARPFDNPGLRLNYSAQLTTNNNSDRWGGRGSLIASGTWGDFGILAGVAAVRNEVRVTGFETIGWTNANLSAAQSSSATRNNTGGGNWTIPGTVPVNAGNGLTPGATIDEAFLLANNPGLNITQIDNALIPRLGRPSDEFGRRDRISAILALEWRPSDDLHFYIDGMYGRRENDLERIDMNWVGRNGVMIPLDMQVDREDCSNGCVVTEGTFANAQFFLEYRPFLEETEFWGVNPGLEFRINDRLRGDIQGNWTESTFRRESPTVLVNTAAGSGVTVEYSNDGSIPDIQSNVDLNDPANFIWTGGRVNIQSEERKTFTRGIRGNLVWGDDEFNIRVGGAYDDIQRRIEAFDNSQAWQNAVCGNDPSVFLPNPNTQPPCQGLDAPGAAPPGYPTYPGYGTGFTAGQTGPVTYNGSLIPQAALASYLRPGPSGFVTLDWDRFRRDSNYDAFNDAAPQVGASNTGANGGLVREKTLGIYGEINGDTELGGNRLRYNAGLRWVETRQTIAGLVAVGDPRNADPDGNGPLRGCPGGATPAPANPNDGACFPNIDNFDATTRNTYDNWLPSASVAYNVSGNAVVRVALSRTMTRPNPNTMLPGVNFSSPSADTGTRGNPALEPFISDNLDLGFEYYLGGESYLAVAAFRKTVSGFTVNGNVTVPFSDLAQYGITFETLSPTQQAAINSRGGPDQATVVLTQQVNADGDLTVNGLEGTWVQSLDFLLGRHLGLNGFGFSVNGTIIDQKGEGAAPAVAIGVARYSYNASVYYENHGFSARLSTTWNEGSQSSGTNQNGIPAAALFTDDYQQWDFSSSVDLAEVFDSPMLPTLTFDVVNIFEAEQRAYFQFENAAFTVYQPGRTVLIGLRGRF
ncbi:TonB-dependent receptor [Sphingosinicella sp. LHD-64]|uniref:TonB-dependent receptor n=1 Tax=Sphingosinicella sp. LHD-64 TaxID=3072139 RepID=UPI00281041A9|nr:TonB-dependent receptor [Sphingosinicella sp. LHD-64]MDQ8757149.1 TonB-dependent receptor [Sphingosinicella sp. LHD-64]